MENKQISDYCLSKPGSYEDLPFGKIPIKMIDHSYEIVVNKLTR